MSGHETESEAWCAEMERVCKTESEAGCAEWRVCRTESEAGCA